MIILGQKEEPMDVDTFIKIGTDRIAIRGYTEQDADLDHGKLEIEAWTIAGDGTLVYAEYQREVTLSSRKTIRTSPWQLGLSFDGPVSAKIAAKARLECARAHSSHKGYFSRTAVAFTRRLRVDPGPTHSPGITYQNCDMLFATHLKIMYTICYEKWIDAEQNEKARSVFNKRLEALIQEIDQQAGNVFGFCMF